MSDYDEIQEQPGESQERPGESQEQHAFPVVPASGIGLNKYWPLTSRDDVFLAIALGAVSPNAIEKLIPPVITNTREWLLFMAGNGGFSGSNDGDIDLVASGDTNLAYPSDP